MSIRQSNSVRAPGWHRLGAINVKISELSPAPGHARRHPAAQIRDLVRSIETFGFNTPVVIDENTRISGTQLRAARAVLGKSRAFISQDGAGMNKLTILKLEGEDGPSTSKVSTIASLVRYYEDRGVEFTLDSGREGITFERIHPSR